MSEKMIGLRELAEAAYRKRQQEDAEQLEVHREHEREKLLEALDRLGIRHDARFREEPVTLAGGEVRLVVEVDGLRFVTNLGYVYAPLDLLGECPDCGLPVRGRALTDFASLGAMLHEFKPDVVHFCRRPAVAETSGERLLAALREFVTGESGEP